VPLAVFFALATTYFVANSSTRSGVIPSTISVGHRGRRDGRRTVQLQPRNLLSPGGVVTSGRPAVDAARYDFQGRQ
jgi:L-alanine-DL-glutamate epimerase-like enolase superfamily enzyme